MSIIEEKLRSLLVGSDLGAITEQLCDFSLVEQNETAESRGLPPSADAHFVPKLGGTVTYIVACVLFNDNDDVLMIEEAKPSCVGKWYLPAGRMERGETICEAAVREVFEETGLNVQVTTLLGIETAGGSWFRFILTGRVTGGRLKSRDQADGESLQARWISNINDWPLRANDILNVIDIGREYHRNVATARANVDRIAWHDNILPTRYSHRKNYLRIVAVIRKRTTNSLNVLVSEKNAHHFPTVEVHPRLSIHSTLRKFMVELFGAELPQHRPHGILGVEHGPTSSGAHTDGICLNVLVVFRPPLEEVALIGKCAWHELSKPVDDSIGRLLKSKHSLLPLNVIR